MTTRAASTDLKATFAAEGKTVCRIWRVTRTDGQVFGFTDSDTNIAYETVVYEAGTGGSVSALAGSSDLSVDNSQVVGYFAGTAITQADLLHGLWDFAQIEVWVINVADTGQGLMRYGKGWLGEVSVQGEQFVVEVRGMLQKLQQNVGRIYAALCDADVGDSRCGVNLDTFPDGRVTTPITSAASDRVFTATGLTMAADWFKGGTVEFMSGTNLGLVMEIKEFAFGGQLTLQMPMPYTVAASDSIKVTVGCLKRRVEDCHTKFSNAPRHRGFDLVPGADRVLSGQ